MYDVAAPSPGDLPETRVHRQPDATFTADGRPVRPAYVVSSDYLHLAGPVLRTVPRRGLQLRRVAQPLHVAYRIAGLYPDMWSRGRFTYTRYRCAGGSVTVSFSGDAGLFRGRQTVAARGRAVSFKPPTTGAITAPLVPGANEICRARFVVTPTNVPAQTQPGSHDTRVLGVRVTGVRYRAP